MSLSKIDEVKITKKLNIHINCCLQNCNEMVLIEISILNEIYLLDIDHECTVIDLANNVYKEYCNCHPLEHPRRVLYICDNSNRRLSNTLRVVDNNLHHLGLFCVVESITASNNVSASDILQNLRQWQFWCSKQLYAEISANSSGIYGYNPSSVVFELLCELQLSPSQNVQLYCLKSFLLIITRCSDRSAIETCLNQCIELFNNSKNVSVCGEILDQFNRIVYTGILHFSNEELDSFLRKMDIETVMLRFPPSQLDLFHKIETLFRTNRSSNLLNSIEQLRNLKIRLFEEPKFQNPENFSVIQSIEKKVK